MVPTTTAIERSPQLDMLLSEWRAAMSDRPETRLVGFRALVQRAKLLSEAISQQGFEGVDPEYASELAFLANLAAAWDSLLVGSEPFAGRGV